MFSFIKLFKKKQEIQNFTIDLSRWHRFLAGSDAGINSVINQNNLSDVGAALAHTDNKTKQRFIESADFLNLSLELKKAVKEKENISKHNSDKAKLILLSTYEAKGFTPLPGFHHL